MKVIRASILGYCMGVERAVQKAELALSVSGKSRKVFTLGPLIHNPLVLAELGKRGLRVMDSESLGLAEPGSTVVIRAHGTTPQVLSELKERGAEVIDATCPRVHASQKRAAKWASLGYTVFIAGDRNHGEVTSICAYARAAGSSLQQHGEAVVLQNEEEAFSATVPENSVLLAQTTFSPDSFEKIAGILRGKNPNIKVFNSICSATRERQEALVALKEKCDGILVIGGRNSANTLRLAQTASSICSRSALIESAKEIPRDFFSMGTVGITAGAQACPQGSDPALRPVSHHRSAHRARYGGDLLHGEIAQPM